MILHRMILLELVRTFLLCLVTISTILTVAGIVKEGVNWGFVQVLRAIPLLLPETLPFTLPTCLLFATCLVYGRLSHDNEILALRASGIRIVQLVRPAVYVGLVLSVTALALSERLIPYSIKWGRLALLADAENAFYGLLQRERQIARPSLGFTFSVRRLEGRTCVAPILKLQDKMSDGNLIAYAATGDLEVSLARRQLTICLHSGAVLQESGGCAYFKDYAWTVSLSESLGDDWTRPSEMDFPEILAERQKRSTELAALATEIEHVRSAGDRDARLADLTEKSRIAGQHLFALDAEVHKRAALSVGCLCFVLVGCPVGIWFGQRSYLGTFLITFLPIVLFYYPMLFCGVNLAKKGSFHPGLDLWMANLLLLIVASGFLVRLSKN